MNTMNQGGNLRYFPQLDPGMDKYKFRLMTSMGIREELKGFRWFEVSVGS